MPNINRIKSIKINNIKGFSTEREIKSENFIADKAIFLVAPNGYGKTTIAHTFSHLKPTKLEDKNFPNATLSIEIETPTETKTLIADKATNTISSGIYSYVIGSPVYAKNTGKSFGGFQTKNAALKIRDVIINKIPPTTRIVYSIEKIRDTIKIRSLKNIKSIFTDLGNLSLISEKINLLNRIKKNKIPQNAIDLFIKTSHSDTDIESLKMNSDIKQLFEMIESSAFKKKGVNPWEIFLQLFSLSKDNNFLNIFNYIKYRFTRFIINKQLIDFNTTQREIKCKEEKGYLKISFPNADSISNGERDILFFISSLAAFEAGFKKNTGLLIIDELFDYLDGCNILAAQYYLSHLINKMKKNGKIFYCVILTHLDPTLFNTCYFKKPKFIYLSNSPSITPNDKILKLLLLRNENNFKDPVSKYFLHYTNETIDQTMMEDIRRKTGINSISEFKEDITSQIQQYKEGTEYDPLSVACAIRLEAEKKVFDTLTDEDLKTNFIMKHKTIEKFELAEENDIEIDEKLYFLTTLYNDALHIRDDDKKDKINNLTIKLSSTIVKKIIKEIIP